MAKAPLAIVCGNVELFVNDPALLPLALENLNPKIGPKDANDEVLALALRAQELIATAEGRHFPSLKDAIFTTRKKYTSKLTRMLTNRNSTHRFLKHFTTQGGKDFIRLLESEQQAACLDTVPVVTSVEDCAVPAAVGSFSLTPAGDLDPSSSKLGILPQEAFAK